jgi:hypothetical protein
LEFVGGQDFVDIVAVPRFFREEWHAGP